MSISQWFKKVKQWVERAEDYLVATMRSSQAKENKEIRCQIFLDFLGEKMNQVDLFQT